MIAGLPVGQGYIEELMALERGFFNEEAQIVTLPKRQETQAAADVPGGRGDVIRFPGPLNRDLD